MRINIPQVLIYLRGEANEEKGVTAEALAMGAVGYAMSTGWRFEGALKLARAGQGPLVRNGEITALPGLLGGWTHSRDLKAVPPQSFREWWRQREQGDA